MRTVSSVFVGLFLLFYTEATAQEQQNSQQQFREKIQTNAIGTGRTSGHIATVQVENKSDSAFAISEQLFFIPSQGAYQSYVGRLPAGITISPNEYIEIPISGYCTDVHTPPVPSGIKMPPLHSWIPIKPGGAMHQESPSIALVNAAPASPFSSEQIEDLVNSPAFRKGTTATSQHISITYPGTTTPIDGVFAINDYPRTLAPLLISLATHLERTVNEKQQNQELNTPFSGDLLKEREAVIQQSLWIVVSLLAGAPYDKNDFTDKVYDQYEQNTGIAVLRLSAHQKDIIDRGIDDFWGIFIQSSVEAQVGIALRHGVMQPKKAYPNPNPWNNIALIGSYMKPKLLALAKSESTTKNRKGLPLWIPIGGGVVAGSIITYSLLNEENPLPMDSIPTDTIPDPGPIPDSLVVIDDTYLLPCLPPATLTPLLNDSGSGIYISSIGPSGAATVQLFGTDALVITDYGGLTNFSFPISIMDSLGNTATSTVSITIDLPAISASDESYITSFDTPVFGNVLLNDSGAGIQVLEYSQPATGGTVTLTSNGNMEVIPESDFFGALTFTYTIQDECEQQATATVTVTVTEPDCSFSATLTSTSADCGFANGSISTLVIPENEYDFAWSGGETTADISNLSSGDYALTISSNNGVCAETFSVTVAENPSLYIDDSTVLGGNCTGDGDIQISLSAPENDQLVINLIGPNENEQFVVSSGVTHLGELTNLFPGAYTLTVYPQMAGANCNEVMELVITDGTPPIIATDDDYASAFQTAVSGNLLGNDSGLDIMLSTTGPVSDGTLTVDDEGNFTFTPADNFTGQTIFNYTITDACGNTNTADVLITIGEPNCDFELSFQITPSDCGLSNGSINTSILPDDVYQYNWSNGSINANLNQLPAGNYMLTVSSNEGLCSGTFSAVVPENPIAYVDDFSASPGNCLGGGEITLQLSSPQNEPLSVNINSPEGMMTINVDPGITQLSDFLSIPAGNYTISVYPVAAGPACSQIFGIIVPDNTPPLSGMNDSYSTPFQTPVSGNLMENDSGFGIQLIAINSINGGIVSYDSAGNFTFTPDSTFTGMGGFNYTIQDNCGADLELAASIFVGAPDCDFSVTFSTSAANCGLSDGSISTTVIPDGTYSFEWSTGASTPHISDLAADLYTLVVSNNGGLCQQAYSVLVTENPVNYVNSFSASPGNCTGGGNIILDLTSPDGGPFGGVLNGPSISQQIVLSPGINNLNESFNLPSGAYSIVLYSQAAGPSCNQSIEIVIPDNTPVLTAVNDSYTTAFQTPVSGNLLMNDNGLNPEVINTTQTNGGSLDINPNGDFTFSPATGFTGTTSFTYTISDDCGNTAEAIVSINVAAPDCNFQVDLDITPSVCELSSGSISTMINPDGAYDYAWSTGATTAEITNLSAGEYSLTVTSYGGFCEQSFNATIVDGMAEFVDSLSTSPGDCAGNGSIILGAYAPDNGTLDVIINGPDGTSELTINSGFTDLGELVNLPSGVYDLVIYPTAVGLTCSEETFAIIEDNTPPFVVNDDSYETPFQTPMINNVLTNDEGLSLQVIDISNVVGGTIEMSFNGDFIFTPNEGATGTASFTYTAMDACTETADGEVVIMIGPSTCNFSLELLTTNASCGFSNGAVSAEVMPAGDYSYSWSTGATTSEITDLSAGTYSLTVIDQNDDCPLSLVTTVAEEAPTYISNVVIVPANCNDMASVHFDLDGTVPGIYTMTVTDPNDTDHLFENIPPGTVELENLLALNSGTYTIHVYNQNIGTDCLDTVTIEVPLPLLPLISLTDIIQPSGAMANDGSFTIQWETSTLAPYQVFVNNTNVGQSNGEPFVHSGLSAGTYEVFVIDNNGCVSNTASVELFSSFSISIGLQHTLLYPLQKSIESPAANPGIPSFPIAPFVEINFIRPSHTYRVRFDQLDQSLTPFKANPVLHLGVQLVKVHKNRRGHYWEWSTGPALYLGNGNYPGDFANNWEAEIRWSQQQWQGAQLRINAGIGQQSTFTIGLRREL